MKLKKLIYQLTSDTNIIDSDKDSTVELIENMINQKVIKELEELKEEAVLSRFTILISDIDQRIKELKQ
jgi:hypothetical protein|tara:strand:- start:37 stop:243 length:207 start_codon:yes stop_codon:yes gene_type:complete